ncbi:MAG: hypothetical protein H6581_31080, partial [Bacteroidia bacterium]|nr:hypothetical protein [Bacteroidia bacterium]
MKYPTEPVKKNPLAQEPAESDSLGQTQAPPAFEVAADSIAPPPGDGQGAHPLDSLQNAGRDTLPAFDTAKTDSVAAPKPEVKAKSEIKPKTVVKEQGKGMFGQEVGLGKQNAAQDVYALMYRLEELGFLTVDDWQAFGADKTGWEANGMQGPFPDCAISKIIKRYQESIGLKEPDEYIEPGKFTEKSLLEGKGGTLRQAQEPSKSNEKPKTTNEQPPTSGPDYECIAQEIFSAGQGWGTNEEKIYKNLALIKAGGEQAKKLKDTFCKLYDMDLEQYLKDELWDWGFYNEESKALGMLEGEGEEKVEENEKDETSDIKVPELSGGATWVIKPLISQESFISQAPPSMASGVTTLTLDQ